MITKNFIYFFLLCFWVVGVIGGFGYAMYSNAYFIGVCILVVGAEAFPQVKKWWKKLNDLS